MPGSCFQTTPQTIIARWFFSNQLLEKAAFGDRVMVGWPRNRLGIRLEGPRPQFARKDGGDGGSHPSNVHDHVYAIGTINFTGAPSAPLPPWRSHPHHSPDA